MATTEDTVALQKGAIAPAQTEQTGSQKAVSLIDSLITGPSLPTNTTISPQLQNVATQELLSTPGISGSLGFTAPATTAAPTIAAPGTMAGTQVAAPTTATAAQMTAATVAGQTPTMTAAQGTVSAPMTAAQGTITSDATVKGQLESLQTEVQTALNTGNPLPVWARGAAKATEAAMANRGLSASSMAAEALAEGIMNSAIPIAQADANTFAQYGLANATNAQQATLAKAAALSSLNLANLNNRQQAAVENSKRFLQVDLANLETKQQTAVFNAKAQQDFMLSDQAADNASKQFNATSKMQTDQFMANLANNISQFNASQTNAMEQFNAGQATSISQFNTQIQNQRDQFNAQNQSVIAQANAQWRRQIATADTAAINRANEINATNVLDISKTAYDNLWQYYSDAMEYAWESADNELDRQNAIARARIAADADITAAELKRDAEDTRNIGSFVFEVLTSWF